MTAMLTKDGAAEVGSSPLARGLPDGRRQVLRRMLETLQEEVVSRVRSLRTTLPEESEPVKDLEEAGCEDVSRDLEIALAERGYATLRRIDEALSRLDEGEYGLCGRCGEAIPEARLRALPFAVRCQECERREEEQAPPPRARL